jgi:ribonuclease Z
MEVTPVVISLPATTATRGGASGPFGDVASLGRHVAKRQKTMEEGGGDVGGLDDAGDPGSNGHNQGVTSALVLDETEAEAVCYGLQMAPSAGKFDNAKAEALGIPKGPWCSDLVHGYSITLENGTVIEPSMVVGAPTTGARIFIADVPTMRHLAEITREGSPSYNALRKLGHVSDKKVSDEDLAVSEDTDAAFPIGDLGCVFHLTPSSVANTPEYEAWTRDCEAFINPARTTTKTTTTRDGVETTTTTTTTTPVRHVFVNALTHADAPTFRASHIVSHRVSAVDDKVRSHHTGPHTTASAW